MTMAWFRESTQRDDAPHGDNMLDVARAPMTEDNSLSAWRRRDARAHKPGFAAADAASRFEASADQPAYDAVLARVKEELQLSRALPPDAYANPQPAHTALVTDMARRAVEAYNGGAASRGVPMLIEAMPEMLDVDASDAATAQSAGVDAIARRMCDDILGWGMLQPFMTDPAVEEIFINGAGVVFVQRAGEQPARVGAVFKSPQALVSFVNNKLDVGAGARTVTLKTPYRDHRLRDGSRIHAIMDPLVSNLGQQGLAVTIRRFRSVARTIDDLIRLETINTQAGNFLSACVQGSLNICVSGGTGTGKTTFLTALTSAITAQDRTVTVEDTPELQLGHLPNWVQLITREKSEGVDAVTMEQLVRHCLRMRPRRILLGEARGAEMVAILEAMNTGHDGCMFTVHADDAAKTLQRIETLYLKAGMGNVPLLAMRREIASAVQIVVNIGMFQLPGGAQIRRVREIAFVTGVVEGEALQQEKIFRWDAPRGRPAHEGRLVMTQARPSALIGRLEGMITGFNWERDVVGKHYDSFEPATPDVSRFFDGRRA
jgi:pilus assembly protein CpaF